MRLPSSPHWIDDSLPAPSVICTASPPAVGTDQMCVLLLSSFMLYSLTACRTVSPSGDTTEPPTRPIFHITSGVRIPALFSASVNELSIFIGADFLPAPSPHATVSAATAPASSRVVVFFICYEVLFGSVMFRTP